MNCGYCRVGYFFTLNKINNDIKYQYTKEYKPTNTFFE